jgi:bacillithiol system protein YtxJ
MTPSQFADAEELERAMTAPAFLIFKHSLVCPTSAAAFQEYRHFLAAGATPPSAWLDVRGQRPLALLVESRTGVRHESPQALLMRDGRVIWHASHGAITRASLRAALGQAESA